ncbi:MAG: hypothetical protein KME12_06665 [Trichocoleus desertorum ATA4-8-CV12]|jgi:apolipoprotein N-acyltransferase|nr:hypothetical protein [Trichocoleus desertorum ATA4-8-CV12]
MSGDRIINMGSGNYNESVQGGYVQGDSINIQGNYINISQDLSQLISQIQHRLTQIQAERKYSLDEAQKIVAAELANQAKNQPNIKQKLVRLGQYVRDGAANGLIGQAAVEVIKIVLNLLNLPL